MTRRKRSSNPIIDSYPKLFLRISDSDCITPWTSPRFAPVWSSESLSFGLGTCFRTTHGVEFHLPNDHSKAVDLLVQMPVRNELLVGCWTLWPQVASIPSGYVRVLVCHQNSQFIPPFTSRGDTMLSLSITATETIIDRMILEAQLPIRPGLSRTLVTDVAKHPMIRITAHFQGADGDADLLRCLESAIAVAEQSGPAWDTLAIAVRAQCLASNAVFRTHVMTLPVPPVWLRPRFSIECSVLRD